MAKKDKFQQLKQSDSVSSFQDMVEQTNTVAAIVQQAESQQITQQPSAQGGVVAKPSGGDNKPSEQQRMTHLPNPAISVRYYNLATQYCYQHDNMTRMDWMEMAIVEKLHRDGLIPDDEFVTRSEEIRSRPPRGMRKNTKTQMNK
jgi:hypothetical protein